MNVLGHNHVSEQSEVVAVTHLAQTFEKEIAGSRHVEKGFSLKTTAGDEMEMAQAVAAFQTMLDHVSTPHSLRKPAKSVAPTVFQPLPRAKTSVYCAPGCLDSRRVIY